MTTDHPFQHLFDTFGRQPVAHADLVNRQAYEILSKTLTGPLEKAGRFIMLRAPYAGHGKTHLLAKTQHKLGSGYEFISLEAGFGGLIHPISVMEDILRRLSRQASGNGDLSVLDLLARRLFAMALQPLVNSGEVPCQDKEGAMAALRLRPIEAFDFHDPDAITAHWAQENFEVLGEKLSAELARRSHLSTNDAAFWVQGLFHFATAPTQDSTRLRALIEKLSGDVSTEMKRLIALLGLLTLLTRVVLVADDLEGFSKNEADAFTYVSFLNSLREAVNRLEVIISINQDIWENAFLPRLGGGLVDRITEVVIDLKPLNEEEMIALLDARVPGSGRRIIEKIGLAASPTRARALIKLAGQVWPEVSDVEFTPLVFKPVLAKEAPAEPPPPPAFPVSVVEAKVELKVEPKVEVKVEPKVEVKVEEKVEPRVEPKVELPPEPISDPVMNTEPEMPVAEVLPKNPSSLPFEVKFPRVALKAPVPSFSPVREVKFQPFIPVNVAEVMRDPSVPPPKIAYPPVPTIEEIDEDLTEPETVAAPEESQAAVAEEVVAKDAVESPFTIASTEKQDDAASDEETPEKFAKPDRVDDLIRQFSERYGRKR